MPPPPYTQLDFSQVIRQVYDEAINRLRVDIGASIVAGALEVAINDVDDSIKIGGGGPGPYLVINPDGSINVDATIISGPVVPHNTVITYNEITGVPTSVETTVTTYTAPIGKVTYLTFISCAGTNIADYRIYKNLSVFDKHYTMFGMSLSTDFDYRNDDSAGIGYKIAPGDVITVKIIHPRPYVGQFNARIQVVEVG